MFEPPAFRGMSLDALLPPEMARKAEQAGAAKVAAPGSQTFVLAVLAGAFIGLGACFATTVGAGSHGALPAGSQGALPVGVVRLLAGGAFSLGLILVVVGGAELFTGNNLMVMALAARRIRLVQLLRHWGVVYVGNFVGAVATAGLVWSSGTWSAGDGAVGAHALRIAAAKCELTAVQALAAGILCNGLVCLAAWLCLSARTVADKVLAIVFPIAAFVTCGFEHSIANMYFVPLGIWIVDGAAPEFWSTAGTSPQAYASLDWPTFLLRNLLPVTLGNIVGGAVLVGLVYWFVFLRRSASKAPTDDTHR